MKIRIEKDRALIGNDWYYLEDGTWKIVKGDRNKNRE